MFFQLKICFLFEVICLSFCEALLIKRASDGIFPLNIPLTPNLNISVVFDVPDSACCNSSHHPATCEPCKTCPTIGTCESSQACPPEKTCDTCQTCGPEKTCDTCQTCPPEKTCDTCQICPPEKTCDTCQTCPPEKTCDTCETCPPEKTCDTCETCPPSVTCEASEICPPDEGNVRCNNTGAFDCQNGDICVTTIFSPRTYSEAEEKCDNIHEIFNYRILDYRSLENMDKKCVRDIIPTIAVINQTIWADKMSSSKCTILSFATDEDRIIEVNKSIPVSCDEKHPFFCADTTADD